MSTDTTISATPFPVATPIPQDTQSPTAPTSLTATNITTTSVTLNWSGATDNKNIDRYELYKDWGYVTAVWGTTFNLTGLTPGKSYLFYIKTRDWAGNSSSESVKLTVALPTLNPTPTPTPTPQPTITPVDTQPPTAPTNIIPSNLTPISVTLNWSGATDNFGINRYELYKDWGYVTAVWGTSFTLNNLTPGKSYLFYLKSRDAAGYSSSESVKLTVTIPYATATPTPTPTPVPTPRPTIAPDTQPPTAPTVLTAVNITSTSVTLNWSGAADNIGINRYELYKDWSYVTAVWGTNFTLNNLSPNKKYLFYLKSRDAAGNSSGESVKLNITTPP
jgi:chitodextrinase